MNKWMSTCRDKRMDGRIGGWMDKCTDRRMDREVDA